jgi:serine protease Do
VVASADKITVTLNDKRKLPATVVGRDRFTDLAVLKIDAPNLKPAPLGNSQKLRAGEFVLAVGSPLGFDHTVTLGIVSAISRRVPDINSNVDFVQTDAAINPGNSGGPLVNLRGEVVGINTAISGIGQNIGFAIPVDVAKQVANQLITHGGITRPWIGLAMTELNPELAKSLGLPENQQGVVVSQVMPNSPSAKAGFKQGDIIQRIDGQKVDTPKTVQEWVQKKPVQSKLNMQILRDGQLMALSVTTDQLPDRDLGSAPARQRPEPPMTPGPGAIPFFGGEDDTP